MKAIIYVRGHNQETQEITCRAYAADKGYKVLFVTSDLESVNNCDVLLVSHISRLTRKYYDYLQITKALKENGIEVESVASRDNTADSILSTLGLLR